MKKDTAAKNSITGLLSQLVITIFAFITRSILIQNLGIAILGLNSTFASVLSALSLAELGFQTAIVYSLYKPLHDDDQDTINDIVNIFKIVYRGVGIFFIAASFVVLPFLKFVLTDIEVDTSIYVYFLLQASASAASYFLAYKRTLLYADQKDYAAKTVDIISYSGFSILEIIAVVIFKNYGIYLLLRTAQVILANAIIQIYCNKEYPYLHNDKLNRNLFKKILKDVKDVFVNRIAGYIYTSTDSLVISAFISTILVGYYANYMTIISSLRLISNALLHPIVPSIGNALVSTTDGYSREKLFYQFSHLRFLVSVIFVIPTAILLDEFIALWVGEKYLLSSCFVYLVSIDLYIHIVHSSTYDFVNALGLFKIDKYIEIAGAMTNIILSIIFAKTIGIEGVLVGTVIGQCIFWIGRSLLVYKQGFKLSTRNYILYWIRNIIYFGVFLAVFFLNRYIVSLLTIKNHILHFIVSGCIIEFISFIIVLIVFYPMQEHRVLIDRFKRKIKK